MSNKSLHHQCLLLISCSSDIAAKPQVTTSLPQAQPGLGEQAGIWQERKHPSFWPFSTKNPQQNLPAAHCSNVEADGFTGRGCSAVQAGGSLVIPVNRGPQGAGGGVPILPCIPQPW